MNLLLLVGSIIRQASQLWRAAYLGTAGRTGLLSMLALLVACTTVPPDLGRSDVLELVGARGMPVIDDGAAHTFIEELLREPLSAESSIRIALVNNPELKAEYTRLGFAAADLYAAGRLSNPRFSASFLEPNVADQLMQISLGLALSFTDVITLPARKHLADAQFQQVKLSIGSKVLDIAARAQTDYYRLATATQVAALREKTARAAELSAELAGRFSAAGNLRPRDLALERAAASAARLAALDAQATVLRARAALGATLGIVTSLPWQVPAQLPMPVDAEDESEPLLSLAQASRLDLAAARAGVDLLADRLGVTNWTRWLGNLQLGVETQRETDGTQITGPAIGVEIPVFTQYRDAVMRAEAELTAAIAEFDRLTLDVSNGVRLAHAEVLNTRARVSEYRDALVPQRAAAVARAQEEVNFMLTGVFELIASKQAEYDAYQGYIEAVGDYWLARTELNRAVNNALPSSLAANAAPLDLDSILEPPMANAPHGGHGNMPGMEMGAPMPGMKQGDENTGSSNSAAASMNEAATDEPGNEPRPREQHRHSSGEDQ